MSRIGKAVEELVNGERDSVELTTNNMSATVRLDNVTHMGGGEFAVRLCVRNQHVCAEDLFIMSELLNKAAIELTRKQIELLQA